LLKYKRKDLQMSLGFDELITKRDKFINKVRISENY